MVEHLWIQDVDDSADAWKGDAVDLTILLMVLGKVLQDLVSWAGEGTPQMADERKARRAWEVGAETVAIDGIAVLEDDVENVGTYEFGGVGAGGQLGEDARKRVEQSVVASAGGGYGGGHV